MRVLIGIILTVVGYLIWTSHAKRVKAHNDFGFEASRADTEGGCLIQAAGVGLLLTGLYLIFS